MKQGTFENIATALASLRGTEYSYTAHRNESATSARPAVPFLTISRQAGAGGRSFAKRLAARLNARDGATLPWTVWDNELVERVAAEHHMAPARVAALEDKRPTWLEEMLGGLTWSDCPDELKVFHRVAQTIRTLAGLGHVIIVGRGSAFVTNDMPGGVHLRLVAPEEYRIAATAAAAGVTRDAAVALVREKDRSRDAFYRRHWPGRSLDPERFTATFNTSAVSPDQLVASVLPLIPCAPAMEHGPDVARIANADDQSSPTVSSELHRAGIQVGGAVLSL